MSARACLVIAASVAALHAPACADDGLYRETLTVQLENDFFSRLTNTDEHYTNGVRVAGLGSALPAGGFRDAWAWDGMETLFGVLPDGGAPAARQVGFSIGQSLFTPDDTDRADPIQDDRPYAGWLYVGLSLHETYEHDGEPTHQDVIQLQLGLVGPDAHGETVQNDFHDIIGVAGANGWDNQLRDELGVNLIAERKWRRSLAGPNAATCRWYAPSCLDIDVIPHAGASLGNVQTYAAAGGLIRLGRNLGKDFGPPRILPGLPGSETLGDGAAWGWYVFAGAQARAVARDIFLDGNTFRDSPSVGKHPLVADLQVGFAMTYERLRLTFAHVFRTSEFEEQDAADQFGALSATVRF